MGENYDIITYDFDREKKLDALGKLLEDFLKEEFGNGEKLAFVLFTFGFKLPATIDYISNVDREYMIKALEQLIEKLKNKQDFNWNIQGTC